MGLQGINQECYTRDVDMGEAQICVCVDQSLFFLDYFQTSSL